MPQTRCVSTLSARSERVSFSFLFFLVTTDVKFAEMYLYLASATTASRSPPNTSSEKVALKAFTVGTSSGCAFVSSSSSSESLTAWKSGETTFCPSSAMETSLTRCATGESLSTVSPLRGVLDALIARSMSSLMPVPRRAEMRTTGMPILRSSSAASILSPAFSTASIMLRAMTMGTSISMSCVVR